MTPSRLRKHFHTMAMLLALPALFCACSAKKNTAATRGYQAFITRYNIHYNGDTHYRETIEALERSYEDDFTQLLPLHPANARANEKMPQPQGDFTRSIEKAQKAIQLRSIKKKPARRPGQNNSAEYKSWLRRDEYNPFLHNSWMMMGRAQFMNGDFLGAASTFFYISKHFSWLPATVTEANLWQARSYAALDWLFEAETILNRIKPAQIEGNRTLTHLYNLVWADVDIRSKNFTQAAGHLRLAIETASGPQKYRLNFLLGQVLAMEGDRPGAYAAFARAASSSAAPYRLKFNARIKQSEVFQGTDITPEVNSLRRLARYDRNRQYLDQIYYAIGNLYLSRTDTVKAIVNYRLAIDKSTRQGIDRALASVTLAAIYYAQGKYELAQPLYAQAMPLIPDNYPGYAGLQRRSDYLDRLAVYSQNVTLQDSLLKLSYLTPEEQTAVAQRLVDELKKREKEEAEQARREELLAEAQSQGNPFGDGGANAPNSFNLNTDNSWYFYNPATVTAGKTDFQRRWGSRKLEDDWRRRNKAAFSFNTHAEEDEPEAEDAPDDLADAETEEEKEAAERANDPHYIEYYLRQIPKDDAERAVCNDVIQEGLYNMGLILKDDLADFPASRREFDRLLTRYPDNIYRLDVYYNLYLMAAMQNNDALARHWRDLIVSEFPDSPYGKAMTDPRYLDNLRMMDQRQEELYAQAYDDYLADRNDAVHAAYEQMQTDFPLSKLMPRFMFLDALAYVTQHRPDKFRQTLTEMLQRYPEASVAPYAAAYIKGLDAGRELNAGISNMRGMIWDIPLTNDSTAVRGDGEVTFDLDPASEQILVLLYPTDEVSANQLLYDIARINFTSFAAIDFDLEQMNYGRLGMLIIKPFANISQLNRYIAVLADNPSVSLPRAVRPVIISQADFNRLLETGATFDDYFRYTEQQNYIDVQNNVLPESVFGPAETLPEAEAETTLPETAPDPNDFKDLSNPAEAEPEMPAEPEKPAIPEKPIEPEKPVKPEKPRAIPLPLYPSGGEDDPLLQ